MKKSEVESIKSRMQHAVDVMQRVADTGGNVYMRNWWSRIGDNRYWHDSIYFEDFQVMVKENPCGTAACMVGWCALDEKINPDGYKRFDVNALTDLVIGEVVTESEDYRKIYDGISKLALFSYYEDECLEIYGKPIDEVNAHDVVSKMKLFMNDLDSLVESE